MMVQERSGWPFPFDLTFRLARQDEQDCQRFCSLSNMLYVRKISPAYYYWQFFETPHPSVLSFALTLDEELVGCYGLHIFDFGAADQCLAMALDIMIAPLFQGKGVFRQLAGFAMQQIEPYEPVAVCVMANQRADGAHVYGLGWKRIQVLVDYMCPTAKGAGFQPRQMEFVEIADTKTVQAELEALLAAHRSRLQLFTLHRSPTFLEWRFQRNQRYRYQIFCCQHRDQLFGYLVLKTFRDPLTGNAFGDIVDILWMQDAPDLLNEMLLFALDHFYAQGVGQATTWLQTNTVLDHIGRGIGFEPTERRRYLCGRVLDATYRWIEDPGHWFITMADSEVY